jgi:hypothetical protein
MTNTATQRATANTSAATMRAASANTSKVINADDVLVGKDVLELVSSAMYIDPITIYREYVQNAADAIDAARAAKLLKANEGEVVITIDAAARTVRIRDNGTGVPNKMFARQLTALGASAKRGSEARGFRGVGRLAGLGYCQELVFRSRAQGDKNVSELKWDCRKLRGASQTGSATQSVAELIAGAVTLEQIPAGDAPTHFFEVELRGVLRTRNDKLLGVNAIADYLAQVAPVPFSPEFSFAAEIEAALKPHIALGNIDIRVSGLETPIYRPHRDKVDLGKDGVDSFNRLEIIEVPSVDGDAAAIAWVLHGGYKGAIPNAALIKGLRIRAGNVQVGENALLEDLFPETRFNGWSVGEIHVLDKRIVPNGRRDHFDQNAHFNNLVNHLAPTARAIGKHCRDSSIIRKLVRDYELGAEGVKEQIALLKQGVLGPAKRKRAETDAREALKVMEKSKTKLANMEGEVPILSPTIDAMSRKLQTVLGAPSQEDESPLARLPTKKRAMYEHLFELIYDSSVNRSAAKSLIDRILLKIVA